MEEDERAQKIRQLDEYLFYASGAAHCAAHKIEEIFGSSHENLEFAEELKRIDNRIDDIRDFLIGSMGVKP